MKIKSFFSLFLVIWQNYDEILKFKICNFKNKQESRAALELWEQGFILKMLSSLTFLIVLAGRDSNLSKKPVVLGRYCNQNPVIDKFVISFASCLYEKIIDF